MVSDTTFPAFKRTEKRVAGPGRKLMAALEQGKLCGVEERLLQQGAEVLAELGDEPSEEEMFPPPSAPVDPRSPADDIFFGFKVRIEHFWGFAQSRREVYFLHLRQTRAGASVPSCPAAGRRGEEVAQDLVDTVVSAVVGLQFVWKSCTDGSLTCSGSQWYILQSRPVLKGLLGAWGEPGGSVAMAERLDKAKTRSNELNLPEVIHDEEKEEEKANSPEAVTEAGGQGVGC